MSSLISVVQIFSVLLFVVAGVAIMRLLLRITVRTGLLHLYRRLRKNQRFWDALKDAQGRERMLRLIGAVNKALEPSGIVISSSIDHGEIDPDIKKEVEEKKWQGIPHEVTVCAEYTEFSKRYISAKTVNLLLDKVHADASRQTALIRQYDTLLQLLAQTPWEYQPTMIAALKDRLERFRDPQNLMDYIQAQLEQDRVRNSFGKTEEKERESREGWIKRKGEGGVQ